MDSYATPLINALKEYGGGKTVRFHMPGHKGRPFASQIEDLLGLQCFRSDVTNIPGMDDLHQPKGIIREAQRNAAALFGASRTYFLINGCSCGLQALIMAVCQSGEKIILPRNVHRSILAGITLSGARPVYYLPPYCKPYGIPLGSEPADICRCLDEHPDAKAVLVVSPSYHGIVSDIGSIAEVAHRRGIPLLVDEAHGAHLYFHPRLPRGALTAGADGVVHGTHKMIGAFTQAAMLHTKGKLINAQRLEAALRMLQSTSTSYLLLASLEAACAAMATNGESLFAQAMAIAEYAREYLSATGFSIFSPENEGRPGVHALDTTRLTISMRRVGATGYTVEKYLREKYGIQVEMSDFNNILLLLTPGNSYEEIDRLTGALVAIGEEQPVTGFQQDCSEIEPYYLLPTQALTPRQAFFRPAIPVPIESSPGHIAGETIACYPPGVPVICPGEIITAEIVDYLLCLRAAGACFQGCHDPRLETVHVIA